MTVSTFLFQPLKKSRICSGPAWFTKDLRSLRNFRNRMHKRFKVSGSAVDYIKYSVAKCRFNSLNKTCYNNYLNLMRCKLKSNPKDFYKFVNSKRKTDGFPSTMRYGNTESSEDLVIADFFANFFESTYSNDNCLSL